MKTIIAGSREGFSIYDVTEAVKCSGFIITYTSLSVEIDDGN